MNKLLVVVPRDTVSQVNGNPQIYNNVAEINRRCEILSSQDPTIKDVVFNIVGFFSRGSAVKEITLIDPVSFKLGDNVDEIQKLLIERPII